MSTIHKYNLPDLSEYILETIFLYLDIDSLKNIGQTCSRLKYESSKDHIWKKFLATPFESNDPTKWIVLRSLISEKHYFSCYHSHLTIYPWEIIPNPPCEYYKNGKVKKNKTLKEPIQKQIICNQCKNTDSYKLITATEAKRKWKLNEESLKDIKCIEYISNTYKRQTCRLFYLRDILVVHEKNKRSK